MANVCKQETDYILLVEGLDDCHVIMALCNAHHLPVSFGIYECGGDDPLLKRLNALILQSNAPKIIGIVMDADADNVAGRWQQIKAKLKNRSYSFPENPNSSGTIINGDNGAPKLGIWLMPDNTTTGNLETFLIHLADPNSIEVAESCVRIAQEKSVAKFNPNHYSKAVIHTYLAWQEPPGRPLGQSITTCALKYDIPIAAKFLAWLKILFA